MPLLSESSDLFASFDGGKTWERVPPLGSADTWWPCRAAVRKPEVNYVPFRHPSRYSASKAA